MVHERSKFENIHIDQRSDDRRRSFMKCTIVWFYYLIVSILSWLWLCSHLFYECRWFIMNEYKNTYDTLRQTNIIGWWVCCWLIWTACIPQNTQLLHSPNTTFTQTTSLYPICSDWLIGIDYEIISFTWFLSSEWTRERMNEKKTVNTHFH